MAVAEARFEVPRPEDMEALGARLAGAIFFSASASSGGVVFLSGDLGAGKTTLARGLLRALGHRGAVKSPTFTLVEPYELNAPGGGRAVNHFDLYRIEGVADLEGLGFRDYLDGAALCLIEWPERGARAAVAPDLEVRIDIVGTGRVAVMCARTPWGRVVLSALG
ncbi:MAG: tRNA (adenosine(37)-N6)-threonylcarbamoyltransferase complex ATPase subunit type 1 TsaE [Gammaproteobacteria bacterium]